MKPVFDGLKEDTTEENMQARLRGLTLMSLSNKFGSLLLTTGNKTNWPWVIAPLYGDMCGGLAVIPMFPRPLCISSPSTSIATATSFPAIPSSNRQAPSYVPTRRIRTHCPPTICSTRSFPLCGGQPLGSGHHQAGLRCRNRALIVRRVDLNEYKREQAAPGLKVSGRAFGMGRRMPIAQKFVA